MKDNNSFAGSEYSEALKVLRTIIQEQRYEDFYNGLEVYLLGRNVSRVDRRRYIDDNVVLPFVMNYIIGRRLHGDKPTDAWQGFFKEKMSGLSWDEYIRDSMTRDAKAFSDAVKVIQKNIDDFVSQKE